MELKCGTERIWGLNAERNGYGVKMRNGTDMGLKFGTDMGFKLSFNPISVTFRILTLYPFHSAF